MRGANSPFIADAVICAHNAASTLSRVADALPRRVLRSVVVVDRGSRDNTAQIARDAGALVLRQGDEGYGSACKRAVSHLESLPRPPDAVVFVGADGSDPAEDVELLLAPLIDQSAELVIGVRANSRTRPADRVALSLIGAIYRHRFTAMSSFRAIRLPALVALSIDDGGSGWDAEMQVKAVKLGLQITEVPVGEGQGRGEAGGISRTSRMLFRILRHSTAR